MEKDIMFYLAAFIGVVVHFILKIRDAKTKNEVFDWKGHGLNSIIALVLALVLVAFRGEIIQTLAATGLDVTSKEDSKLLWCFIGYFSDSVWKNITSFGSTVLKTGNENKPETP